MSSEHYEDQYYCSISNFIQRKVAEYNPSNLLVYSLYDGTMDCFDPFANYHSGIVPDFYSDLFADISEYIEILEDEKPPVEVPFEHSLYTYDIEELIHKLEQFVKSCMVELTNYCIRLTGDCSLCYLYVYPSETSCDFIIFS
jgi:hypothetical protein